MTQLSSNTVIYDQIIAKVSNFISMYRENKFTNNQEFLQEYQNLINYLSKNISRTINGV
jgi:hypothetical protein